MPRGGPRVRPERVAEQIRMEIGEILQRELKDPRVRGSTCTRVQVSGDLKVAKVYVSVLAEPDQQKEVLRALEHASGFVRRLLGQRLALRSAPEIRFVFDPSVEYGIELERLLDQVRPSSDEPRDPGEPVEDDPPEEPDRS